LKRDAGFFPSEFSLTETNRLAAISLVRSGGRHKIFSGSLFSLDQVKGLEVHGEWVANQVANMTFWPGWIHATNNQTILLGSYTLKLCDGREGLILVVGHADTSPLDNIAVFEGQGKLPALWDIG
jgi:hypothetical protein